MDGEAPYVTFAPMDRGEHERGPRLSKRFREALVQMIVMDVERLPMEEEDPRGETTEGDAVYVVFRGGRSPPELRDPLGHGVAVRDHQKIGGGSFMTRVGPGTTGSGRIGASVSAFAPWTIPPKREEACRRGRLPARSSAGPGARRSFRCARGPLWDL